MSALDTVDSPQQATKFVTAATAFPFAWKCVSLRRNIKCDTLNPLNHPVDMMKRLAGMDSGPS